MLKVQIICQYYYFFIGLVFDYTTLLVYSFLPVFVRTIYWSKRFQFADRSLIAAPFDSMLGTGLLNPVKVYLHSNNNPHLLADN